MTTDDGPSGFELWKGLDGLLLGASIVFLVKVETTLSAMIDWGALPGWTRVPVRPTVVAVGDRVSRFVTDHVAVVPGASGSSGDELVETTGRIVPVVVEILGVWAPLAGVLSASLVEQALVVLGGWIAFLVPLWWWVLNPARSWTRDRFRATRRGRLR